MSAKIDRRTNGYKARRESLLAKPEAAILLIQRALAKILGGGLDVIGMVKQLKQRYSYQGRWYTLPELRRFVRFDNSRDIFGSIVVATKTGIQERKRNRFFIFIIQDNRLYFGFTLHLRVRWSD